MMASHPILMSSPMVLAILREIKKPGTGKTETRRVARPAPGVTIADVMDHGDGEAVEIGTRYTLSREQIAEPKHKPGDRLYVREAWQSSHPYDDFAPSEMSGEEPIYYRADGKWQTWGWSHPMRMGRKRIGMHMPRWASRITLVVDEVRVERLHEITEAGAIAEGLVRDTWEVDAESSNVPDMDYCDGWSSDRFLAFNKGVGDTARDGFGLLWDSLNAARGHGWNTNPWVTVTRFTPHLCNIDQMEARDQ